MRKSIDLTVIFGSHRIYKPNSDASSSSTHKTTLSSIYPMAELLIDLRRILDEAIETIISVCERRNEDFPHLDTPADPSEFSPEGIRNDPEVAQAIKLQAWCSCSISPGGGTSVAYSSSGERWFRGTSLRRLASASYMRS